MMRLKEFLRQNALWVGLLAVAIPLAAHLWLQYHSLSKIQETMPHARKAFMRKYLTTVIDRVVTFYEGKADEVLNVPSSAFHHEYPNPDFDYHKAIDLDQVYSHFTAHQFKGAQLLFAGSISGPKDPSYIILKFYDPISCTFKPRGSSREWSAAHSAAANWMAMIMSDTVLTPKSIRLSVDERDPQHRVIVKPIVDEKSRVVGVTGMFLNKRVFIDDYLSAAVSETIPSSFPDEYKDVVVTVINREDELLYSNQPFEGKAYEVGWPFPFIFTDWFLGIRMLNMTEEEMSKRYFLVNLSFSILTALVLIGGIILTLRAASRAMKLSQMKADFVSNVSHELRTPLASIRVFGEFLKLGRIKDQNKIHEYGEYIETESRRLTQLINNILDFSKIESGQKTYQFEEADVEPIVTDTLKTFEVMLEQNGFAINYEKPVQHLPPVIMDSNAIAQAFINLLDNAVKYSGDSKEIDVKLGQQNGFVTIEVRDHGIGIAREDCEKVFEKFYRVGNSLIHDVKGSGLGLSIVKHIVEAHEGKVDVESEPGRGSTFIIYLPTEESGTIKSQMNQPKASTNGAALGHGVPAGSGSAD
jgi:signal transduction histidine kinase